MSRYADHPMDFADATLVYLAARESIPTVFTVDQADFSTYRVAGRRRFRILPIDQPRRYRIFRVDLHRSLDAQSARPSGSTDHPVKLKRVQ
jgi:hypothetical protein